MNKILYLAYLLLTTLVSLNLSSQTNPLELDNISYSQFSKTYNPIRYADTPLGDNYKTYSVTVIVPDSVQNREKVLQKFRNPKIEGFTQVGVDESPDLSATITITDVKRHDLAVTTSESPERKGIITLRHRMLINYNVSSTAQLKDNHTGKLLTDDKLPGAYKWENEAQETKGDNMNTKLRDLTAVGDKKVEGNIWELISGLGEAYTNNWSNRFGTRRVYSSPSFYQMADEKFYESYFFQIESSIFKEKSKVEAVGEYISGDTKQPERFIQYNENLIEKYKDTSPKALLRIKSRSYYNIALMHFWEDNFDMARQYVEKGLATGEIKKEFEQILQYCDQTIESLKKNGETTRFRRLPDDPIRD